MEYKILTSRSASGLMEKVKESQMQGWNPIGSHQVVEKNHQLRYSGMQHKDTQIECEYSQTMTKNIEQNLADKLNQAANN